VVILQSSKYSNWKTFGRKWSWYVLSESFIKICSLTFLDRRIAAGMPSSRGEDWQPLLMYRNSLVHGETDQPPVTSKRAYSRKKKEYAGKVFLVIYQDKQFNLAE
jgi:hypothetical protein